MIVLCATVVVEILLLDSTSAGLVLLTLWHTTTSSCHHRVIQFVLVRAYTGLLLCVRADLLTPLFYCSPSPISAVRRMPPYYILLLILLCLR